MKDNGPGACGKAKRRARFYAVGRWHTSRQVCGADGMRWIGAPIARLTVLHDWELTPLLQEAAG